MSRQSVVMTGASGFIGARLQAALLETDRGVTAVIRPSSPNLERISPACTIVRSDLEDEDQLASACSAADAVIYCAGTVRGRGPADFNPANVGGVGHLVGVLNHSGSQIPFLLISSLAASRPEISDYARSKHLGEEELTSQANFPWTIFRPPAVYGPGDTEIRRLLRMARQGLVTRLGPPDQRLSLLHVDDLSDAVIAWLDSWRKCQGQTFSLDDGRPGGYDWQAIAAAAGNGRRVSLGIPRSLLSVVATANMALSAVFNYPPMLTPGKVRELTQTDWLCDNTRLTRATGWKPSTDLQKGIRQMFGRA